MYNSGLLAKLSLFKIVLHRIHLFCLAVSKFTHSASILTEGAYKWYQKGKQFKFTTAEYFDKNQS